jgi:hypothetical protein
MVACEGRTRIIEIRPRSDTQHCGDDSYQGLGWPLHDDFGIATDIALEEQLELVSASAVSPAAGVFGPASIHG